LGFGKLGKFPVCGMSENWERKVKKDLKDWEYEDIIDNILIWCLRCILLRIEIAYNERVKNKVINKN
jgi:hypothetical protein